MNCMNRLKSPLLFMAGRYRMYATSDVAEGGVGVVRGKNVRWFQDDKGVRRITLQNPKARNCLSQETINEILAALVCDLCDNKRLRCFVIDAEGPVFSSGHNLKELRTENGAEHHKAVFSACHSMIMAIRNAEVPVVAKVGGLAAAAGCQLVASCDIVVASEKATFSTPGVNYGIFCSTPGVALVRSVPKKLATLMLYTGKPIDADSALRAGLVSSVVPENELDARTEEIVDDILAKSKAVVRLGKGFLDRQIENPVFHRALEDAANVMLKNLQLADAQEGISSFVEKRKPVWTHRKYKAF